MLPRETELQRSSMTAPRGSTFLMRMSGSTFAAETGRVFGEIPTPPKGPPPSGLAPSRGQSVAAAKAGAPASSAAGSTVGFHAASSSSHLGMQLNDGRPRYAEPALNDAREGQNDEVAYAMGSSIKSRGLHSRGGMSSRGGMNSRGVSQMGSRLPSRAGRGSAPSAIPQHTATGVGSSWMEESGMSASPWADEAPVPLGVAGGGAFSQGPHLSASVAVVSIELALPQIVVPTFDRYSDVFGEIEARERAINSLRTFLSSIGYIRGNHRILGDDGLRRARSKLARILARLRMHTTTCAELISLWRRRQLDARSLAAAEAAASVKRRVEHRISQGKPVTDAERQLLSKLTRAAEVAAEAAVAAGAPRGTASASAPAPAPAPAPTVDGDSSLASAAAAAPAAASPVATGAQGEVFYWLGHNYMHKMAMDLAWLPVPTFTDPLLLNWWHYEAPDLEREEALCQPPYALTRHDLFPPGSQQYATSGASGASGSAGKPPPKLNLSASMDSPEQAAARLAVMREAAAVAEGDWWFDAARLHSPKDIVRMGRAQQQILAEASKHPPPRKMRMPLDEVSAPDERPLNDLGREMEVILYGRSGGFALKLQYVRSEMRAARSLQCMARLRMHQRRVQERALQRQIKAAEVVQRRWRNRSAANLSGLSDFFANLSMAAHKDAKLEQQRKEEAERLERERLEAEVTRDKCLKRRWVALRSCVKEVKLRMLAAMRVQCMVRMHTARRMLKLRQRRARISMREMNSDEANAPATMLQKRLRTHQAASALLCDQYERRQQWYDDSRLASILSSLAGVVSRLRLARRDEARALRYALGAAAAADAAADAPVESATTAAEAALATDPNSQRIASEKRLAHAWEELWAAEGTLVAIDGVLHAISAGGYTLDLLMKMRSEAKRGHATSAAQAEKDADRAAELQMQTSALAAQLEETRGAGLGIMALHQASEVGHILTCGQLEGLRRKVSALEPKYASTVKDSTSTKEALSLQQKSAVENEAALKLISTLLSREVAQDGGEKKMEDARAGLSTAAAVSLLNDMRPKAEQEAQTAREKQQQVEAAHSVRLEMEVRWAQARGAARALSVLRTSLQRFRLIRLERRRQEALGMCIATAQAKVAHRHGKRTLCEVSGSRELLSELRKQMTTRPRPTLQLAVMLPQSDSKASKGGGKGNHSPRPGSALAAGDPFLPTATRLAEDCIGWMGWPDSALCYHRHEVKMIDAGRVLLVELAIAPCRELEQSLGASSPQAIGGRLLDECQSGRILPGLVGTASTLELGSLSLAWTALQIPSRDALAAHCPPLYKLEQRVRNDLAENESAVSHALQQVEQQQRNDGAAATDVQLAGAGEGASPHQPPSPTGPEEEKPVMTDAERAALARSIAENRHAMSAASALSAIGGMHSLGNVTLGDGLSLMGGKWGQGDGGQRSNSQLRFRMVFTSMTGAKARLAYARTERDVLYGRLSALQAMKARTRWGGAVMCSGDAHAADEEWNHGGELGDSTSTVVVAASSASASSPTPKGGARANAKSPGNRGQGSHPGAFCIFCAQQGPPVLARHTFADCYQRMLSGEPPYAPRALDQLGEELTRKETRTAALLARFESQVERRKAVKAVLDQTVVAIKEVKRVAPPLRQTLTDIRLDGELVPLPQTSAPRQIRFACALRLVGYNERVRYITKALAEDYSRASELLPGGGHGGPTLGTVWAELKAILVLRPRRSLLLGGMAALAAERQAEVIAANAAPPDESELAARAKADKELKEAKEEAAEAAKAALLGDAIAAAAEKAEASVALKEAEEAAALAEAAVRKVVDDRKASQMVEAAHASSAWRQGWQGEAAEGGVAGHWETALAQLDHDDDDDAEDDDFGPRPVHTSSPSSSPSGMRKSFTRRAQSKDEARKGAAATIAATATAAAQAADVASAAAIAAGGSPPPQTTRSAVPTSAAKKSVLGTAAESKNTSTVSSVLWCAEMSRVVTPAEVHQCARALGILLPTRGPKGEAPDPDDVSAGEYDLLPLACELICAPLPGEWREVLIDGQVHFREGATGTLSQDHPLTDEARELVAIERRRPPPKLRYPPWLHTAAMRVLQFVTPAGVVYSYDFGSCSVVESIRTIIHHAMLGESDNSAFATGDRAAVEAAAKAKEAAAGAPAAALSAEEAAAAAVVSMSQSDADVEASAKQRQLSQSGFGNMIGKAVYQKTVADAAGTAEGKLRQRLAEALHTHYDPIIGSTLAWCPRQLRVTFEAAIALGIELVKDMDLVWLADLAQSLPSPLGWAVAEHPVTEQPTFWHNELTGVSQWQHPTDEFIKSLTVAMRSPLQSRAKNVVVAQLGEATLAAFGGS